MKEIVKNLKQNEKIIAIIRKYFLSLFKDILFSGFLFILSFLSLYFILQIENNEVLKNISFAMFGVCLLVALFLAVKTFFIWTFDSLVITNLRIFDVSQNSIFNKNITEIDLKDIKSVSCTKNGIFRTIFNFGDLNIETQNEAINIEIKDIKDPIDIQQLINDRKGKLLQQENQNEKFDSLSEEEIIGMMYKLKERVGIDKLNDILRKMQ